MLKLLLLHSWSFPKIHVSHVEGSAQLYTAQHAHYGQRSELPRPLCSLLHIKSPINLLLLHSWTLPWWSSSAQLYTAPHGKNENCYNLYQKKSNQASAVALMKLSKNSYITWWRSCTADTAQHAHHNTLTEQVVATNTFISPHHSKMLHGFESWISLKGLTAEKMTNRKSTFSISNRPLYTPINGWLDLSDTPI